MVNKRKALQWSLNKGYCHQNTVSQCNAQDTQWRQHVEDNLIHNKATLHEYSLYTRNVITHSSA